MSETTQAYSVVYQVTGDKSVHEQWWQSMRPLFLTDGPIVITSVTKGDLAERVDQLEKSQQEIAA